MASKASKPNYTGVTSPLESRDSSSNRQPSRPTARSITGPPSVSQTRKHSTSRPPSTSLNHRRASRSQQSSHRQNMTLNSGTRSRRPSETFSASTSQPFDKPQVAETRRDGPSRWPVSPHIRSPLQPSDSTPTYEQYPMQRTDELLTHCYASSVTSNSTMKMPENETDDSTTPSGLRTPTMNSVNAAISGNSNQATPIQETGLPSGPGESANVAMAHINDKLNTETQMGQQFQYLPPDSDSTASNSSVVDHRSSRARSLAYYTDGESSQTHEGRRLTAGNIPAPPMMSRQSSTFSTFTKSKPATDASSMIVESETVSSVPQIALATVPQSTLRPQPSTETIRPKKERKGRSRKQAVTPGAASSKAEIFEYQVGRAVDENNDSDSDETFVYDSSTNHDPPLRYRSRTPSVASTHSQIDRPHRAHDASGTTVTSKKNMKFASNYSNGSDIFTGDSDGRGSGRSNAGSSRGPARHASRFGRNHTNNGPLFDNESPFTGSHRSKLQASASRANSGPPSPRFMTSRSQPPRKGNLYHMSSSYDLDETGLDETGLDDERTPLIYSNRSARNTRQSRRTTQRHLESQTYRRTPSALNHLAACLVMTMMVLLIITGAIGFIFATTQPLTDIALVSIDNVLASEPELMLDATLHAHNPNIVVVTIEEASLEVFAKSIHAGTDYDWYKHLDGPRDPADLDDLDDIHLFDDPPEDLPEETAPNFRLGTITQFDSPLSFEGLFFHRGVSHSTAGLRLALPGNSTAGGSARWGRIIQDDFDLIIKGTIKYYLPLSQRIRSASIAGRVRVKSNAANNPSLTPNSTVVALGRRIGHL